MPDLLTVPYPAFVTGGDVLADNHNDNWAAIKAKWDARFGALTAGHLLIANGSGVVTGVALSGDGTITSAGVLTLANNSVNAAKIASNAVGDSEIGTLPAFIVKHTTPQAISGGGAPDDLSYDTEVLDTEGTQTMPDTSLPVPASGLWALVSWVQWDENLPVGTIADHYLTANAVIVARDVHSPGAAGTQPGSTISAHVKLTAGQIVSATVAQDSGLNKNIYGRLSAVWLGEG